MTMWVPDLEAAETKSEAIAEAIARDIERGRLCPGDRLPPQRRLAEELGLAVGTVSRGYGEAEERGLVVGEVGRGTFVRRPESLERWGKESSGEDEVVNLGLNLNDLLPRGEQARLFSETLRAIADSDTEPLLRYRPDTGLPSHRSVAARWIRRTGLDAHPDDIVITAGAQHALSVILSNLLDPGDVLLTARLTYPGLKSLAQCFGVRIRGVEMDEEGIVPDALEEACARTPEPKALYLVPTLQNPMGGTLSPDSREAIAEIAERHDVLIVEDDIHVFLTEEPPLPIAARAPGRTLYLLGLSKVLNIGLRTGFVVAPTSLLEKLRAGVRSSIWIPAPLMAEITSRWIREGTADRIAETKRARVSERQESARRILDGFELLGDPRASHLWLRLPEGWRSDHFVQQAADRNVKVTGAGAFAVSRDVPAGVRLSLGRPGSLEEMVAGVETIREILEEGPVSSTTVI